MLGFLGLLAINFDISLQSSDHSLHFICLTMLGTQMGLSAATSGLSNRTRPAFKPRNIRLALALKRCSLASSLRAAVCRLDFRGFFTASRVAFLIRANSRYNLIDLLGISPQIHAW